MTLFEKLFLASIALDAVYLIFWRIPCDRNVLKIQRSDAVSQEEREVYAGNMAAIRRDLVSTATDNVNLRIENAKLKASLQPSATTRGENGTA